MWEQWDKIARGTGTHTSTPKDDRMQTERMNFGEREQRREWNGIQMPLHVKNERAQCIPRECLQAADSQCKQHTPFLNGGETISPLFFI